MVQNRMILLTDVGWFYSGRLGHVVKIIYMGVKVDDRQVKILKQDQ